MIVQCFGLNNWSKLGLQSYEVRTSKFGDREEEGPIVLFFTCLV